MDKLMAMEILTGMCGLVLLIVLFKRKFQGLLYFLLRMVAGAISFLWITSILAGQGMAVSVGLNAISLLTSGILGIPGVALLYAIVFTKNL